MQLSKHPPRTGELLVAILNDPRDFAIAREHNWYRIPVSSARKWIKDRWPPEWLAPLLEHSLA